MRAFERVYGLSNCRGPFSAAGSHALRKNVRKDLFAKIAPRELKMNGKIFGVVVPLLLAMGWAFLEPISAKAAMEDKGIPAIVQSFAATQIKPGQVWKVYLKASDPDGKMKYIFATISQPGVGNYPVSIIRIKEENGKELSGYIYLNTSPIRLSEFFNRSLTLTVNIQGKGGQFSEPAVFPLFFQANPTREAPPEGVFKEQSLGPIRVTLRTGKRG
jgi:hypothetical protein